MRSCPIIEIVVIVHLIAVKLSHILIEFFHICVPLLSSTHIVELIKVISVIRNVRIHVLVAIETPVLVTFVLSEALSSCLTPLRKWIFFYYLKQ